MDLWDVVRLMLRRWYVSVPLLLLTVLALVATGLNVSPNHTSEGHVMFLPPSGERAQEEGEDRVLNPFDTDSVMAAAITRLRNRNLAAQVRDEGYQATWEVERDIQFFSVVAIQVTAATDHEAQEVVNRLLDEVDRVATEQQATLDVPDNEKITTVRLAAGENVETVRGNQIRAMIVVFAACLIMTMGVTIGVDAVARRRATRATAVPAPDGARAGEAAPSSPAAPRYATVNGGRPVETAPNLAPSSGGPRYASAVNGARLSEVAPSSGGGTVYTASGSRAEVGEAGPHAPVSGQPQASTQAPIQVSYRPPAKLPAGPSSALEGPGPAAKAADDSTIVLPLSGATRLGKTGDPDTGPASGRAESSEADEH